MLSEELIDNNYDDNIGETHGYRGNELVLANPQLMNKDSGRGRAGIDTHLTPTKKKRRRKDGSLYRHSFQGRCRNSSCGAKTKYMCSTCNDGKGINDKDMFFCHTSTGRLCFTEHVVSHSTRLSYP